MDKISNNLYCITLVLVEDIQSALFNGSYNFVNLIGHLQNHLSPQNSLLRKLIKKKSNASKHTIYFMLDLFFPKNNWQVSNFLIQL
jgi:hypothetical protein